MCPPRLTLTHTSSHLSRLLPLLPRPQHDHDPPTEGAEEVGQGLKGCVALIMHTKVCIRDWAADGSLAWKKKNNNPSPGTVRDHLRRAKVFKGAARVLNVCVVVRGIVHLKKCCRSIFRRCRCMSRTCHLVFSRLFVRYIMLEQGKATIIRHARRHFVFVVCVFGCVCACVCVLECFRSSSFQLLLVSFFYRILGSCVSYNIACRCKSMGWLCATARFCPSPPSCCSLGLSRSICLVTV